ncbi:MAG: hypothetical protein KF749_05015 [Bacteroidetes bacterium]|nr:hypothetical protein [Bacteroidota bacterium]MCW5896503.1 hypothetical protein [Bacteroidota bacterium]
MREAVYEDAILIAQELDADEKIVWARIKGLRFASVAELISLLKEMQQRKPESGA